MLKNPKTEQRHSCFLKVSDYYKKYFEIKYGTPVRFPKNSVLGLYMQTHLFRDADFSAITEFSYNEIAFRMNPAKDLFSLNLNVLNDSEKKDFIELEMPQVIYRPYGEVCVDGYFHLSVRGCKKIRNELKNQFWMDFSKFHDECMFLARRNGEVTYSEDIMSDFMNMYDIDMKIFESMMRYWRRFKSRTNDEIEERRDLLEKHTGRIFEYTP